MSRTFHIYYSGKGWTVQRDGFQPKGVFPTQKAAIKTAEAVAKKAAPSQVVLHGKTGKLKSLGVYGLPKIQEPHPTAASRLIEKAMSKFVIDRLMATARPNGA